MNSDNPQSLSSLPPRFITPQYRRLDSDVVPTIPPPSPNTDSSTSPTQLARQQLADTLAGKTSEFITPPVETSLLQGTRDDSPTEFPDIIDIEVDLHHLPDMVEAMDVKESGTDGKKEEKEEVTVKITEREDIENTLEVIPEIPSSPSRHPSQLVPNQHSITFRASSSATIIESTPTTGLHSNRSRTATSASSSTGTHIETDTRWRYVLDRAIPAIVTIRVMVPILCDTTSAGIYSATGFIIDANNGLILTNKHVVTDGPALIRVVFRTAEEAHTSVEYVDPVHDFAIIRFDPNRTPIWRDSMATEISLDPLGAKVGAEVRVPGADDGEKLSILQGTIARIDRPAANYGRRTYCDINTFYIQASTNTSGGSSGSPVLNEYGFAVALNAGGSRLSASSFFLPLDRVVSALKYIQQGERVPRGTLMVEWVQKSYDAARREGLDANREQQFRATNPILHGCLSVRTVLPGGPGAGILKPGDLLLAVNHDWWIAHFAYLAKLLDENVGQSIRLHILRGGKEIQFSINHVMDAHETSSPTSVIVHEGDVLHTLSVHLARSYWHKVGAVLLAKGGQSFGTAGVPNHSILVKIAHVPITGMSDLARVLAETPHGARIPVRYYALAKKQVELIKIVAINRISDLPTVWLRESQGAGFLWTMHTLGPSVIAELIHRDRSIGLVPHEDPIPRVSLSMAADMAIAPKSMRPFSIPGLHIAGDQLITRRMRELAPSLVAIEFRSDISMDGVAVAYMEGIGIVINNTIGLVLLDRWTVPLRLASLVMIINNTAVVPLRILAMDPVQTTVWAQYDPTLPEVTGLRGLQLPTTISWESMATEVTATASASHEIGNQHGEFHNENNSDKVLSTELDLEAIDPDDHHHAGPFAKQEMCIQSESNKDPSEAKCDLVTYADMLLHPGDKVQLYSLNPQGKVIHMSSTVTSIGFAFFGDPYPPKHISRNLGSAIHLNGFSKASVIDNDQGYPVAVYLGHAPNGNFLGTSLAEIAPQVVYFMKASDAQIRGNQSKESNTVEGDVTHEQGFGGIMDMDAYQFSDNSHSCSSDLMSNSYCPNSYPVTRLVEVELTEIPYSKALFCGLPPSWVTRIHAINPYSLTLIAIRRVQSRSGAMDRLQAMDIVLTCNGQVISKVDDLMQVVFPSVSTAPTSRKIIGGKEQQEKGDMNLTVFRDGQELEVKVPYVDLTWAPCSKILMWNGAVIQEPHWPLGFHMQVRHHAVYTSCMYTGTPAHRDGLTSCHFIISVNGQSTPTLEKFLYALGITRIDELMKVDMQRGGWEQVEEARLLQAKKMPNSVMNLVVEDLDGVIQSITVETQYDLFPLYIVEG